MRVFDASSMIYAWDNYPVQQFPGLWEWMADQISTEELQISAVAFDEVAQGDGCHVFTIFLIAYSA